MGVHGPLTLVPYALPMERGIWLLAAYMVHKHGLDALVHVERRLVEMQQQRAQRSDSRAHIEVWCQVARAVLAIMEPEPDGTQSVH